MFRRFTKLDSAKRHAMIEAIRTSRSHLKRSGLKALSATVMVSHYGRPTVQRAVGYDGKTLGRHYQTLPPSAQGSS
jgi:hypothetical protein